MTKAQELQKKYKANLVSMGESTAFYEACNSMGMTTVEGTLLLSGPTTDEMVEGLQKVAKVSVFDNPYAPEELKQELKQECETKGPWQFGCEFTPSPGTVLDIDLEDDEQYFGFDALSQSGIKQYLKSPSEFWRLSYLNPDKQEFKETDATVLGNLAHCLLLEPHNFTKGFYVADWNAKSRDTQKYQKFLDINKDDIAGRKVVTQAEYDKAEQMTNFLKKLDFVKTMLNGASAELPIVWYHSVTGQLMKTKIDSVFKNKDGEFIIVDYKTTGNLEKEIQVTKNGYDVQFAVIKDAIKCKYGKEPVAYINIIQSTKENDYTNVRLAELSHETIEVTEIKVAQAIREINERYEKVKQGVDPEVAFMNALNMAETEKVHGSLKDMKYWKAFEDWSIEHESTDRAEFEKYYSEEQLNMYISTLYKQW